MYVHMEVLVFISALETNYAWRCRWARVIVGTSNEWSEGGNDTIACAREDTPGRYC